MRPARTWKLAYLVFAALGLVYYGAAELRGWGASGEKRPPLDRQQLRQKDLGYRNHVFWYHGFRGK